MLSCKDLCHLNEAMDLEVHAEIEESKFGKRKHKCGRMVDGHWVFGGMEEFQEVFSAQS